MEEIRQVRWTPEALDDLGSLRDFVAARNPVAAGGVLARIFEAAARLARFPRIGHHGRVPGTRELVVSRTPYFLVYRVEEPAVEILRVMHGARRWPPTREPTQRRLGSSCAAWTDSRIGGIVGDCTEPPSPLPQERFGSIASISGEMGRACPGHEATGRKLAIALPGRS